MRPLSVLFAAALALCSCARPARAPRSPGAPSQILLKNALPWPYRLERIELWVDGVLLYRGADDKTPIANVALSPGDHSVQAVAVASFPATPLGPDSCPVRLSALQGLRLGAGPARIEVVLTAADVSRGFIERLALGVRADGAERIVHHPLPHLRHDAALPDSPAAALAGLQDRLEQARERRDPVAAACYRDKVEEALGMTRLRERSADWVHGAAEAQAVGRAIDGRILRAYLESNDCEGGAEGYDTSTVRGLDAAVPACALGQGPAELAGPAM